MYFEQCTAAGHVDMSYIHKYDGIMDIVADRLFRSLQKFAEEAGIPDFRAEDCDLHTHAEELEHRVQVRMVWNPQPGHIELLGGPQDGMTMVIDDADLDHVRVFPPRSRRDHWAEPAHPVPRPVIYARWRINGTSRRWVYRYTA
jgi:hypothetical protein